MRIVVLAAGVGSRLGRSIPKPLTRLTDGRSIMQEQLETFSTCFPDVPISVVVGLKKACTGDEDVKYDLDGRGAILHLSKTVEQGLGEALGINHLAAADKATLIRGSLIESRSRELISRSLHRGRPASKAALSSGHWA